jgi:NADPH:quinone reductase-like Zn-dependent oxidoreductase
MSTRRALVTNSKGGAEVKDVPLPKLRDEYIIVKTKAVALNPTDWKSLSRNTTPGAIVGVDYAGVVEEIGSKVTKSLKIGDKVAGMVYGCEFEPWRMDVKKH